MTDRPPETGLRVRGIVFVLLGGLCLSSGGVLVRAVEHVDPMTILFYRAVGLIGLILLYLVVRYRQRTVAAFRAIGASGIVMGLALGTGFSVYVFAVLNTTVANVVFIISSGPLFAALLGWMFLRERVSAATWAVIVGAAVGMALMFADGMGSGGLFGILIAVLIPLTFAMALVVIRRAGDVDMVPAACLGGVVALAVGAAFGGVVMVPIEDLLIMLALGVAQLGAGFLFITIGARYLPAAETALLALTESIAAPIWAWLFIGEIPAALSLMGGLIVLTCVITQGFRTLRRATVNGGA